MGIASLLGDRLTDTARSVLDGLKAYIAGNVDVDRILSSARSAAPLSGIRPFWEGEPVRFDNPPVIGYVRDACLWFYYRETWRRSNAPEQSSEGSPLRTANHGILRGMEIALTLSTWAADSRKIISLSLPQVPVSPNSLQPQGSVSRFTPNAAD